MNRLFILKPEDFDPRAWAALCKKMGLIESALEADSITELELTVTVVKAKQAPIIIDFETRETIT